MDSTLVHHTVEQLQAQVRGTWSHHVKEYNSAVRTYGRTLELKAARLSLQRRRLERRAQIEAMRLERHAQVGAGCARLQTIPVREDADASRPGKRAHISLRTLEKGAPSGGMPASILTPRQREIAALVARGLSNAQIAAELVLCQGTVANHVEATLTRLGLRSRVQVAVWAIEQGIYSPDSPATHQRAS